MFNDLKEDLNWFDTKFVPLGISLSQHKAISAEKMWMNIKH